MKTRSFYNNIAFRLLAPTLFGLMIYLLVLMFFDSIEMLGENFFSREVLFTILLSYIFFEVNRLIIVLCNAFFGLNEKMKLRVSIQYMLSFILSALIISLALFLYFVYVEGFSTIITELLTFNALFLLVAVFYHLFFFSLLYLGKRNDSQFEIELGKRESLEAELQAYKYQINPDLLFKSLEIIISELHQDKEVADKLLSDLSKVYRYTLDNHDNELVELNEEIKALESLFGIFKSKYLNTIALQIKLDEKSDKWMIIPGSLRILLEKALSENIISEKLKLEIDIETKEDELIFRYKVNPRIVPVIESIDRMDKLKKAYSYFSSQGIRKDISNGHLIHRLPLLEIVDE